MKKYNEKIKNMQKLLKEKNYDAAVFFDPVTINYFCGFFITDNIFMITAEKAFLTADMRYYEAAAGLNADVIKNTGGAAAALHDAAGPELKIIGIDPEKTTVSQRRLIGKTFRGAGFRDIGKELKKQAMVKTDEDILLAKRAQQVTDGAFSHILSCLRPGVTENELAAEIEYFIRKEGCGLAFDTIVVSGRKTSVPHGVPSDKKIENGDFVTMDFGARFKGVCSDMTRTVAVGKVSEKQKRAYGVVLEAQTAALDSIRAGMTGKECDAAARDIIDRSEFASLFTHSLGHGIGYEIHEAPNFSPSYSGTIPAGALMSCEPGIYVEGEFGLRVEDMLVVGENGIENLTRSDKRLIIL